jgi:hypothetical protein
VVAIGRGPSSDAVVQFVSDAVQTAITPSKINRAGDPKKSHDPAYPKKLKI